MLLTLLACDPGSADSVRIVVSSAAAAAYSPEVAGFVFVDGGVFESEAVGTVCGGGLDLVFYLERSPTECGSVNRDVEAWISTADRMGMSPERAEDLPCGAWAETLAYDPHRTGDEPAAEGTFVGEREGNGCTIPSHAELRIE